MKRVERFVTVTHAGQSKPYVYASDYDALMVERDELLEALKAMCAEFRSHDLPYGSAAYAASNLLINKLEQPQ